MDGRRAARGNALWLPVIVMIAAGGCAESSRDVGRDAGTAGEHAAADSPPRRAAARDPDPASYVGSEACRRCHAAVCDSFHAHPMGRSLAPVADAVPLERSTADEIARTTSADGEVARSWAVESTETQMLHHERVTTADGEVLYDRAVPVHYAVGSGKRGRSYMIDRDGLLFLSPLSWYSQQQRWDLSPGYAERNLHFGRRVIDACVGCHAGRVNSVPGAASRFAAPPFREHSIGCERCHGPGRDHIAFQDGDRAAGTDPIVNPQHLPPRRRDHVCFQCHLIGEYRLLRYGRSDYDFLPGDDLTDVWTIVLRNAGTDGAAAVSQAEQMLDSKCYQESAGAFGCISCHDAHAVPDESEQHAFYRSRCLRCHDAAAGGTPCAEDPDVRHAASRRDSCIACHMPSFQASDIPHTSQTDHRVLRRPTDAERGTGEDSLRLTIFGEHDGTIPEPDLRRARAILLTIGAESSGDPEMAARAAQDLQDWLNQHPDDLAAIERLGTARALQGRPEAARAIRERGLEQNPDHEELLTALFVSCEQQGDYAAALLYGQRIMALNPWEHEYPERMARISETVGDTPSAIRFAEQALAINPAAHHLHQWLADRYQAVGDEENAMRHRTLYRQLSRLE